MPTMQYALSGQPLSRDFRAQLESICGGEPQYVLLSELRRLGAWGLVKQLKSMRGERLVIALESPQALATLPALVCFAALTGVRRIELVDPGCQRSRVTRWQTAQSLSGAAAATAGCFAAVRKARGELRRLLKQDRVEAAAHSAENVLYAKTNMSFAVRAGGSVGHVAGVCGALAQLGHAIDFLAVEEPVLPRPCVRFHRVPPPAAYGLPYDANLYRYQHSFVKQALKFAAGRDYAFIYQRLSLGNYAGPLLSRKLGRPLVVEYNGSEAWVSRNWGGGARYGDLAEQSERAMLRHAHLIVTVSNVLRDELIERGVEPRRIVSYPNCIDPEVFDPGRFGEDDKLAVRGKWRIPADAQVACFLGTFGQWHGVEVLARAIRQLWESQREWCLQQRLHFLLVGDGIGMAAVREELRGVDRSFYSLTGLVPQDEAPSYLAAADVLLSPHVPNPDGSRFFGSPTKLFEYMAMGKPIIASDLEQIGEVLHDSWRIWQGPPAGRRGSLALLTRPESIPDLITALRQVLENRDLAARLGSSARREALAKYTWRQHVEAILDRLHQL